MLEAVCAALPHVRNWQTPSKGDIFKDLAVIKYTVLLKRTFSVGPSMPGQTSLTPEQLEARQDTFAGYFQKWITCKALYLYFVAREMVLSAAVSARAAWSAS
jgi:hypothetical protein